MNSMSKKYYDSCEKRSYEKEEKCPTIIKCGCPSTVGVPVVLPAALAPARLTLASLTIDTECICDPVIKINFTSAFTKIATAIVGAVNIQIYKQCKNQVTPTPVGPSWPITSGIGAVALGGSVFTSFFVCDSDSCGDSCCTYTAVATVDGVLGAALGASFVNSTLSAEITCRSNECKRKCNS